MELRGENTGREMILNAVQVHGYSSGKEYTLYLCYYDTTVPAAPFVLVALLVRVRVNSSVRRAGRGRVRVSSQDVVETGYAPSS
jgi:hypothetical protein